MLDLTDPTLLRTQALIDGKWADADDGATQPVIDPATGGTVAEVARCGTAETRRSIEAAEAAGPAWAATPAKERARIEKRILMKSLDEVWEGTETYWSERDPKQVERAKEDGRHKMALCFRWYLGMTSRWARTGEEGRKRDFQVWCGPAMGAFNQWASGTALEPLSARTGPAIAEALMRGAAAHARVSSARAQGVSVPSSGDAVGLV